MGGSLRNNKLSTGETEFINEDRQHKREKHFHFCEKFFLMMEEHYTHPIIRMCRDINVRRKL